VRTLLAITLTAVGLSVAAVPSQATVNARINRWVAGSPYAGRHTGFIVWDSTSNRYLAWHNVRGRLRPASNMKLLTTAATLVRLGVGSHLTTRVLATGTLSAGTLRGNLYLVGGGDPSLDTDTYSREAWAGVSSHLSDLAAAVRAAGIRRVTGRLYGDPSVFDSRRTAPYWKSSYWRDCPPLSGLSVNESLFRFGYPQASSHPARYAAQLMVRSLHSRGVIFAHGPAAGTHPSTAWAVAAEQSPPVTRLLRQMDLVSDNYFAETLTKDLAVHAGRVGSTANGVRAIRNAVSGLGVGLGRATIYDGSGLSLGDRLTAGSVLALLRQSIRQPWGWYYLHSLPLAGVSGTLSDRMTRGLAHRNVTAKTGTLDDASALSGFVTAANGHRLLFSILINHSRINVNRAHALQDRICQYLAAIRPSN
jgi:D-alanyl-D-alanine carboxypeptidase/D-alanyl-D-alanine-endopeptidase (penicillin-binding protein 4)